MKTKCYCIYCVNHPLYGKRNEFNEAVTGYEPGNFISREFDEQGREVKCLQPFSGAFYELSIQAEDFVWEVTAYGDGCAITGFEGSGFTIYANCKNEKGT